MKPVRILIVDDDPLAQAVLVDLCRRQPQGADPVTVGSGADAIEEIRLTPPDLVLLDVELGDMSGFDVLRSLESTNPPPVVLVTGHEEHALRAFEAGAVDYLMKPVLPSRFEAALARLRSRELGRTTAATQMPSRAQSSQSAPLRLVGEKGRRLHFLPTDAIDYIAADGNYVTLHVGASHYLRRDSIKHLTPLLAPHGFERIRRDTLINISRVAFAEKQPQATIVFTMLCGARLTSRSGFRLQGID
jgi:two-component system LytT family response regulator